MRRWSRASARWRPGPERGRTAARRRPVQVLQTRAGISQADLAQEVAASPASCWRRVKALEAAGVLRDHVRLVDPYLVGRGIDVICQVRMKSHEPGARRSFEEFVQGAIEHKGSWWPDWIGWLEQQDDNRVAAAGKRAPGGKGDKVIEDAPGRYVKAA